MQGHKADMEPHPRRGGVADHCRQVDIVLGGNQDGSTEINRAAYAWRELHVMEYCFFADQLVANGAGVRLG